MKTMLLTLTVLSFALVVTACGGPSCKDLCEKTNKCAGVTTPADCTKQCDQAETLNGKSNCGSKYDDLLSCADKNSDKICETNTACDPEAAAYVACVMPYCSANPTDTACQ